MQFISRRTSLKFKHKFMLLLPQVREMQNSALLHILTGQSSPAQLNRNIEFCMPVSSKLQKSSKIVKNPKTPRFLHHFGALLKCLHCKHSRRMHHFGACDVRILVKSSHFSASAANHYATTTSDCYSENLPEHNPSLEFRQEEKLFHPLDRRMQNSALLHILTGQSSPAQLNRNIEFCMPVSSKLQKSSKIVKNPKTPRFLHHFGALLKCLHCKHSRRMHHFGACDARNLVKSSHFLASAANQYATTISDCYSENLREHNPSFEFRQEEKLFHPVDRRMQNLALLHILTGRSSPAQLNRNIEFCMPVSSKLQKSSKIVKNPKTPRFLHHFGALLKCLHCKHSRRMHHFGACDARNLVKSSHFLASAANHRQQLHLIVILKNYSNSSRPTLEIYSQKSEFDQFNSGPIYASLGSANLIDSDRHL